MDFGISPDKASESNRSDKQISKPLMGGVYAVCGLQTLAAICAWRYGNMAFLILFPVLVASYLLRSRARDTWLESHLTWSVRTFWAFGILQFAFYWAFLFFSILAMPGGRYNFTSFISAFFFIRMAILAWFFYRVIRGGVLLFLKHPTRSRRIRILANDGFTERLKSWLPIRIEVEGTTRKKWINATVMEVVIALIFALIFCPLIVGRYMISRAVEEMHREKPKNSVPTITLPDKTAPP